MPAVEKELDEMIAAVQTAEEEEAYPTFFGPSMSSFEGTGDPAKKMTTGVAPTSSNKTKKQGGLFKSLGRKMSLRLSGYPLVVGSGIGSTKSVRSDLTETKHLRLLPSEKQEFQGNNNSDTDDSTDDEDDTEVHIIAKELELYRNKNPQEKQKQQKQHSDLIRRKISLRNLLPPTWRKGIRKKLLVKNNASAAVAKTKDKEEEITFVGENSMDDSDKSQMTYGQILGNLDALLEAQREQKEDDDTSLDEKLLLENVLIQVRGGGTKGCDGGGQKDEKHEKQGSTIPLSRQSRLEKMKKKQTVSHRKKKTPSKSSSYKSREGTKSKKSKNRHSRDKRKTKTISSTDDESRPVDHENWVTPETIPITPSVCGIGDDSSVMGATLGEYLEFFPQIKVFLSSKNNDNADTSAAKEEEDEEKVTCENKFFTVENDTLHDDSLGGFIRSNSIVEGRGKKKHKKKSSSNDSDDAATAGHRCFGQFDLVEVETDTDSDISIGWDTSSHTREPTMIDAIPGIPLCRSFTTACCNPLSV